MMLYVVFIQTRLWKGSHSQINKRSLSFCVVFRMEDLVSRIKRLGLSSRLENTFLHVMECTLQTHYKKKDCILIQHSLYITLDLQHFPVQFPEIHDVFVYYLIPKALIVALLTHDNPFYYELAKVTDGNAYYAYNRYFQTFAWSLPRLEMLMEQSPGVRVFF